MREGTARGYALALHGGAGTLAEGQLSRTERHVLHAALRTALGAGREVLAADGGALDAVESVVVALENSPYFNAGFGACLSANGDHELDAAIMDGRDLRCGAVAGVRHVRNPVRAARGVMDHSGHVLLAGAGADAFAEHCGLAPVDNGYFTTPLRRQHWRAVQAKRGKQMPGDADLFRFGTVGAVARDRRGHLAAATSTGGVTNKRWGRVGDSPIIGAGTLADDRCCAVSCTGAGELFIRHGIAHEISARLRLAGQSLEAATGELLKGPLNIAGGSGGVIAIDHGGRMALAFNTRGMYRAWCRESDSDHTAIEHDVHTHG